MLPTKAENPFQGVAKSHAQSTGLVEVESQRAIQEVQAAMVIAKKFPRDQIAAMDRILTACTRPTLAEGALYSYSRGGSDITGPSIRLAEAIAQTWGNMQFGIRELSQANGESTVEAFAWDVETNTRQVKVFQVPHVRYTRSGSKKLEDPRDIYELVANQGARRLRACILGVIPGDVVEAAVKQCEITQSTSADTSPDAIKKMVDAFADMGVTSEMIQKRIQKRIEAINPAQMVHLRKVYTSLRDGMSSVTDWFEVDSTAKEPPKEPPAFTEEQMADGLPKWKESFASGKGNAEKTIAFVSTRYSLTEEQKAKIRALEASDPEQTPTNEPASSGEEFGDNR